MNLDENKKYGVFKALATKTFEQVGYEFGFDKHYKDSVGMKNAVHRVYMEVKTDPERFAVDKGVYDLVLNAVAERSSRRGRTAIDASLREANLLAKEDTKALLTNTRNDVLSVIYAKVKTIAASKKKLDAVPLGTLAQTFGILFDKAQILQGEATENVAVLAKVKDNLPADELLKIILSQKERNDGQS